MQKVLSATFPYSEDILVEYFSKFMHHKYGDSIMYKNIWTATDTPYFVIFNRFFEKRTIMAVVCLLNPDIQKVENIVLNVPICCMKTQIKQIAYYLKERLSTCLTELDAFPLDP